MTTIKQFTKNGREYHVFTEIEDSPYLDCYFRERGFDDTRIEAYERGDWCMLVVACEIRQPTATNWATPTLVGRDYLHGVESDSDPSYFEELAKELIQEAEADLRDLQSALTTEITD